MSATHIQCGVVNHRINREPLDSEQVNLSYNDLKDHVRPGDLGGTYTASFYAGFVTSVTSDDDNAYNGPYYISYNGASRNSYVANKMVVMPELEKAVEDAVEEITGMTTYWGHL